MQTPLTRRTFLRRTAGAWALSTLPPAFGQGLSALAPLQPLGFPLVDFHVHLDNSTLDRVLELSRERQIKFGIVEHAGTKENKYPVVLSNDTELSHYLSQFDGKAAYKGIQAEWIDWGGCFSTQALGQLDYALSDAMTFPGSKGQRMKLWEKGAEIGDPQRFMDRYVDWHLEILAKEPLDILANTTWLPSELMADYEALWTTARMEKLIGAAIRCDVALEISASYRLPKLPFLKLAKAAGAKFSFGSNGRYPNMGKLEYSIEMARALGLTQTDMFMPKPAGQKPWQRSRRA